MWFFIFQSIALLSVACAFGVFAGWLFWGGEPDVSASSQPPAAATIPEGASSLQGVMPPEGVIPGAARTAELDARDATVTRLRQKLKRAVADLEKRTEQLAAARDEQETLQLQFDALASQLAGGSQAPPSAALAIPETLAGLAEGAEGVEGDAPVEPAEPTESALALADFERRINEANERAVATRDRAEAAEERVETLRESLMALERESDGRLAALNLDLASARLRADAASRELSDFAAELAALRDTSAAYIERTQSTMTDLQARLDGANSALSGKPRNASHAAEVQPRASLFELVSLPGMTHELSAQLRDIGVQSVSDIAGWTPDDVDRFQAWLPDHPRVIERNSWVEAARTLVSEAEALPESGGGADEERGASGVFFDARSHEIVG